MDVFKLLHEFFKVALCISCPLPSAILVAPTQPPPPPLLFKTMALAEEPNGQQVT